MGLASFVNAAHMMENSANSQDNFMKAGASSMHSIRARGRDMAVEAVNILSNGERFGRKPRLICFFSANARMKKFARSDVALESAAPSTPNRAGRNAARA